MRTALRAGGWLLIAVGVLVAAYLARELWWTGVSTDRAQAALLESFPARPSAGDGPDARDGDPGDVGPAGAPGWWPAEPSPVMGAAPAGAAGQGSASAIATGDPVAIMEFLGDDGGPVVLDEAVVVVEGVGSPSLAVGPGRYPGSAAPGAVGNFAVAGHRTTYGAPFAHLDQMGEGDRVVVTDVDGVRWTYEYVTTRVVAPDAADVLIPDPLGDGTPVLTLTTCHPRWSDAERLIVVAELVEPFARR